MSTNRIFEDLPSRKEIPAAAPKVQKPQGDRRDGPDSEEKRVRQAVYDIRYRARREEIPLAQAYSQYMQNASLSGAEKIAVRKKLFEEYEISNMISDGIASAMFKVFVEGIEEQKEDPSEIYLREFQLSSNVKYKVRVTDKSGRSYVRYANREKIEKLRGNPNIKEVEMTGYGEPYEGEKKKGEETARALGGGPKAKRDYDGDGKIESGAKEYRGVVHNAIQKKKGLAPDGKDTSNVKEEFIDEKITSDLKSKKITGKGVNNKKLITIYPTLGSANTQVTEETIEEKAVSTAQQKFFGMVHAYKSGKMKDASPSVKKAAKTVSDKEAEKFASTKHKNLPAHVKKESLELDEAGMPIITIKKKESDKSDPHMTSDLKKINPDDKRAQFAKDAKVKNTLRAMGVKNVMVVGEENDSDDVEQIDELNRYAKETGKSFRTGKKVVPGGSAKDDKAFQMVSKMMGSGRAGVQPRGKKKEPGKKPPAAGEYGGPISPAQKVAKRRSDAQRSIDSMSSRFD